MTDDAADESATTEGDPPDGRSDDAADATADGGDEPSTADEIRWAAFDVLVEDGFDAFTTQAVADEAGVSQSLVHYHYDTKEDLVFAMFTNGLDHLTDEVRERADSDDPRERLLELARYMLRTPEGEGFQETVEFSRMLLEIEAQAPYDDRLRDAVEYDSEFLEGFVTDAVEEGIESGQFRDVEPEPFAVTFVAAIRSGQNRRAIFADDERVDPVLDGVVAMVDDYLGEGDA
ncbi:TetR family transcriptional regulator [Halosimplex carlsbadense 2-9-1]|uniref:TetR family transcriptional regulator n=1 Tax=Halosimplex carlsbadense 2-9-1 TaxID=797114 RepID=M0D3K0_9EURY|nr:TetR/AcrR family transcriptional regulator [Halosimplex carlsbadense]ELZ29277.1 TetR family transcriptional regulator [Halosimplex carlsbadense 2-9-1]